MYIVYIPNTCIKELDILVREDILVRVYACI